MANEAILIIETEKPIPMTCADGTGIEKGAVCKLTSPMTAILSDGDNDYTAGIAQSEKIANTGVNSVSIYRGGVFRMHVNGAVTAGQSVGTSSSTGGANQVAASTTKPCGIALQDGTDEDILVEINFGAQA